MADPSLFDGIRLAPELLVALDNRVYHFAMQPWHYMLRMTHVMSASAFFGGILLFDLRLIGVRSAAKLKAFGEDILPWLYVIFAVAFATGVLLFLYDPVKIGSRAYFSPKLLLLTLGLANAILYNTFAYGKAVAAETGTPLSARVAGALSILFWVGVTAFSSMNVEGAPKLLLQAGGS